MQLQEKVQFKGNYLDFIEQSPVIHGMLEQIKLVAKTEIPILILGETGTGKELAARAIHELSKHNQHSFIKVSCHHLTTHFIEGGLELPVGSTLFLDEIGELPLNLQALLLHVLQEKAFACPVNAQTMQADLRVIASTNRNLLKLMQDGQFRQDLYYRLHIFPITCLPLRERKQDIPLLTDHFVKKYSHDLGKQISRISEQTRQALADYHWPGNIRELENIIQRALLINTSDELQIGAWFTQAADENSVECKDTLDEFEKKYIFKVLEQSHWRIRGKEGAAERLGLKPTTLESKMERLGIKRL